uniref:Uncharacterized protein n=1 Tax=Anguilla anguilla TaxID=7936 RepID=A0A0E9PAK7_ANGAN
MQMVLLATDVLGLLEHWWNPSTLAYF